jgi:polysaccharide export outer membrane protein
MKKIIDSLKQIILFELVIFLTACSISPRLLSESPDANKINKINYKIRAGDVVELKFENYPDFNQTIIVDTNGKASLKVLGEMNISGLSAQDLETILYEKYGLWLIDPKIELMVRKSANFPIYIGGEVRHPGIVKFKSGITVAQGIILAGGLKDQALAYEVLIFRNKATDGLKTYKIKIEKNVTGRESSRNFKLEPYDVVYVMKTSGLKPDKGRLI